MKTYIDGLRAALDIATGEIEKANAELDHAERNANFAPNALERSRVRKETSERIARAIRKCIADA